MPITSLIDNLANPSDPALAAEHGLSIAIAHAGRSILFDTGITDKFAANAQRLGVDIANVDAALLSHHHFDHGGGLDAFFAANSHARLYLRRAPQGQPTLRLFGLLKRDIGLDQSLFHNHAARFEYVDHFREILPGVLIITNIPKNHPQPKGNRLLPLRQARGWQPDTFDHELILVIQAQAGLAVFSGCSHNGILNMLDAVTAHFPGQTIQALFGGFHLIGNPLFNSLAGSPKEIEDLGRQMLQYPIQAIYTGHCTGMKAYPLLKRTLGEKLHYFAAGDRVDID